MRHFVERGKLDSDGLRHSAKMAWRALALLQKELEREAAMEAQKNGLAEAEVAALAQAAAQSNIAYGLASVGQLAGASPFGRQAGTMP